MKSTKSQGGRPTVFTEEVLQKLEDCFRVGLDVEIACIEAEISQRAFYYKLKKDEGFLQRMRRAQNFPIMVLHQKVYHAIQKGDARLAWDVLQKKCPDKYGKDALPRTLDEEFGKPEGWAVSVSQIAR